VDVPAVAVVGALDVEPVVPVPVVALVRMKDAPLVLPDVDVPDVPVVPALVLADARCTQPVTVTVLFAAVRCDVEAVWEPVDVCATSPAARPKVIAAHAADQVLNFIVPP
jgi:hypothetical protein